MAEDNDVTADGLFDGEPVGAESVSGEELSARVEAAMAAAREREAGEESEGVRAAWQRLNERCAGRDGAGLPVRDLTDNHNLARWMEEAQGDVLAELVGRRKERGEDPEAYIWQKQLARLAGVKNPGGAVLLEIVEANEEVVKNWMSRSTVWSSKKGRVVLYEGVGKGEGANRWGGGLTEEGRAELIAAFDGCMGYPHGEVRYFEAKADGEMLGGKKVRGGMKERWVLEYPEEHYPPYKLARQMLALPSAEFPALDAVLRRPVLSRMGQGLIYAPGYYWDELVYMSAEGVGEILEVRDEEEVRAAMAVVWRPFREFPWDGPASRANFLAALFTGIAGRAARGPLPGFLFGKAQERTGATMLARLVSLMLTGVEPAAVSPDQINSRNPEELVKALVTAGLGTAGAVMFDNLSGTLRSSEVMAYLTSLEYKRRFLGTQKEVTIDRRNHIDLLTANNLMLTRESAPRLVSVRLDAQMPNPETRTGFEIDPVDEYVLDHRAELLGAWCGIVQAWWRDGGQGRRAAGEPNLLGGFESWRGLCWSFLTWLDGQLAGVGEWEYEGADGEVRGVLGEFLGNQEGLETFVSGDGDDERDVLGWLWFFYQSDVFQAAEVTRAIKELGAAGNEEQDFDWARAARADGKKGGVSYAVRSMLTKLVGRVMWLPDGRRQVQLMSLGKRGSGGRLEYRVRELG